MNGINELIGDEFGPAEIFPNSVIFKFYNNINLLKILAI